MYEEPPHTVENVVEDRHDLRTNGDDEEPDANADNNTKDMILRRADIV